MSETMSFGNLVNALNTVRSDYNEQLKSIRQYEVFLLVESSTQKVAETLNEFVNSPKPTVAADVITALELAKAKFKEHLTSVPEYRALLAIDRLITEVSIDLGVQPAPQTVLPTNESESEVVPHEIASTQPEPDQAVSASQPSVTQPEAAEIASPQETAGHHDADLLVSALAPTAGQPGSAETAPTHQTVAAQPEPDQIVSASEEMVTEPKTAEIALAQPTTAAHDEPPGTAASADSSQAPMEDLNPFAEPPPTRLGESSERAA